LLFISLPRSLVASSYAGGGLSEAEVLSILSLTFLMLTRVEKLGSDEVLNRIMIKEKNDVNNIA